LPRKFQHILSLTKLNYNDGNSRIHISTISTAVFKKRIAQGHSRSYVMCIYGGDVFW